MSGLGLHVVAQILANVKEPCVFGIVEVELAPVNPPEPHSPRCCCVTDEAKLWQISRSFAAESFIPRQVPFRLCVPPAQFPSLLSHVRFPEICLTHENVRSPSTHLPFSKFNATIE